MTKPPKACPGSATKVFPLQRRLRYWQKILRLKDWTITVEWSPSLVEDEGQNEIVEENRESTIYLDSALKKSHRRADVALVHELLHIPFEFARDGDGVSVTDVLLEQGIQQVALGMVEIEWRTK